MSQDVETVALRLATVSGPDGGPFEINADEAAVIGRAADCAVCIADPSVSRDHASLMLRGDRWFITDLGSRHGTHLNGIRLDCDRPAPAAPGDLLRVGPYTFRLEFGEAATFTQPTTDDVAAETMVRRMPRSEVSSLAARRLELLIDGAVAIHDAENEVELARLVLELALEGSGYRRGAVLRHTGSVEQVAVIASRDQGGHGQGGDTDEFQFTRSLVREAMSGHVATLVGGISAPIGQSIVSLDIHSAICAPIFVDSSVVGFLYLDSRGTEPAGATDAGGYCHAVSRLAGLATSSLKRAELAARQKKIERELNAARDAQAFLLPPERGTIHHLAYVMKVCPGSIVAGDLFDLFAMGPDRVAVCCGDVTGQGMGAGILMTAVLSQLRAAMLRFDDPAEAMRDVNRYISERSADDRFVSLWIGVFDRGTGTVHFVDAGHGHWLVKRKGQAPERFEGKGGLLVGIEPEFPYVGHKLDLVPGDRVILFSDGVVEHRSPVGEEFGIARLIDVIGRSATPEADVEEAMRSLHEFTGDLSLKDDTTIASVEIQAPRA